MRKFLRVVRIILIALSVLGYAYWYANVGSGFSVPLPFSDKSIPDAILVTLIISVFFGAKFEEDDPSPLQKQKLNPDRMLTIIAVLLMVPVLGIIFSQFINALPG